MERQTVSIKLNLRAQPYRRPSTMREIPRSRHASSSLPHSLTPLPLYLCPPSLPPSNPPSFPHSLPPRALTPSLHSFHSITPSLYHPSLPRPPPLGGMRRMRRMRKTKRIGGMGGMSWVRRMRRMSQMEAIWSYLKLSGAIWSSLELSAGGMSWMRRMKRMGGMIPMRRTKWI